MAKLGKEIYTRQNEEDMLNLLKAQRAVYSSAKKYAIAIFLCLAFSPLIINTIISYSVEAVEDIEFMSKASLVILISFGVGQFFRYRLKERKFLAACIQQKRDNYIFNTPDICKEHIKLNTHLIDDINNAIRKYKNKKMVKIEYWNSNFSNLPFEQAIFRCQKESVKWSLKQGKKYLTVLIIAVMLILAIIVVNVIKGHDSLGRTLLFFATLMPLISYFSDSCQKLIKDIFLLTEIFRKTEQIEVDINDFDAEKLKEFTRKRQEEIFLYRQKAYLIPDWFYWRLRDSLQNSTDDSAKEINSQYKSKKRRENTL